MAGSWVCPSRSDLEADHNRLDLMVQATTVRYIGVFAQTPVDVDRRGLRT